MPCGYPTRKLKINKANGLGRNTASTAQRQEVPQRCVVNKSASVESKEPAPGAQPGAHLSLRVSVQH